MDFFRTLFSGGHVADIVLAVMAVEAFALSWYSRQTGGAPTKKIVLLALLPGCFLALALRAALVHAEWFWIALALIGALISHLADMRQRWQIRTSTSLNR
jgi:hypothetical protein